MSQQISLPGHNFDPRTHHSTLIGNNLAKNYASVTILVGSATSKLGVDILEGQGQQMRIDLRRTCILLLEYCNTLSVLKVLAKHPGVIEAKNSSILEDEVLCFACLALMRFILLMQREIQVKAGEIPDSIWPIGHNSCPIACICVC